LKGPFVHKKAQENFEKRTHRRVLKIYDTEKEVLDLWLRYLKKNSIGGVGMKAQVWESLEFGYAAKEGEMVNLVQGGKKSEEDIEKAAQALVRELTGEAPMIEAGQEAAKSEGVKAEATKTEGAKPESGESEASKPESSKSEEDKSAEAST
jgi:small subunit ribosomal protein S10